MARFELNCALTSPIHQKGQGPPELQGDQAKDYVYGRGHHSYVESSQARIGDGAKWPLLIELIPLATSTLLPSNFTRSETSERIPYVRVAIDLNATMRTKVFISHGHDEPAKEKLKDFVQGRLHLEAVVLGEQPDHGLTIVEKLEHYGSSCQFALILLTGDDEMTSGFRRARQNVVHELGYFHGCLGRKRVLLIKEAGVELFSNISGLIYKEFPPGRLENVFEDIRLAVESGDASQHAISVPKGATSAYTDGDWITAAIVGPELAETELKKLAAGLNHMNVKHRSARLNQIVSTVQSAIDSLLKRHEQGGETDETRLDACIAKVKADILQRELANFQWRARERLKDDPTSVFRDTITAFVKSESRKWNKEKK